MKILLILQILFFAILSSGVKADDGFQSIFNGKDLSGWKSNEETPNCFSVENGTLKVSGGRAHLFYVGEDGKASFSDFELKVQVMTLAKANSGIFFHTEYQEADWLLKGFECQVNSTSADPRKTGSLYAVSDILVLAANQAAPVGSLHTRVLDQSPSIDGEWFDCHIIVKGKTITIKINDEVVTEWTQPDGFDPVKELKRMPGRILGKGTIALQAHDPKSTAFFKNIQLKISH